MTKSVPVALLILLAANNNLLLSFSAVQLKPKQASQIEYQELILYQNFSKMDRQADHEGRKTKQNLALTASKGLSSFLSYSSTI